jgi:hypothetical protein
VISTSKERTDIIAAGLTAENYYSVEADREYMSCSQYDSFAMQCEAAALAQLQYRYKRPETPAFLVGNYFHSAMESEEAHEAFCEAHFDEIYKTKTVKPSKANGLLEPRIEVVGKYADFEQADKMLEVARNTPQIKRLIDMPGINEVIMTGKLFDEFPFKVRFDKYIPPEKGSAIRTIIDWKTTADIWAAEWNDELQSRVSFIRNFGYVRRAAVYLEIEKQATGLTDPAAFMIVAISKHKDFPDKELINMNSQQELDLALEQMYGNLTRIRNIKMGLVKPKRCGRCAYCRSTKKITNILSFYQLDPGERPPREDEYDELLTENPG